MLFDARRTENIGFMSLWHYTHQIYYMYINLPNLENKLHIIFWSNSRFNYCVFKTTYQPITFKNNFNFLILQKFKNNTFATPSRSYRHCSQNYYTLEIFPVYSEIHFFFLRSFPEETRSSIRVCTFFFPHDNLLYYSDTA